MTFDKLFYNIEYTGNLPEGEVDFITQDSRRVGKNTIFICAKGHKTDGHKYAKEALNKGAICIVTERKLGLEKEVVVKNARKAYAVLCANFFDKPATKMKMTAVTGTNGKSTITTVLKQILEQAGNKVGLIGTIHTQIDTMEIPAKYTTPEAWDLNALLSRMVAAGCNHAVMEASSQALDQMRLWGIQFDVGVFTNLTQDHLDYHGTFENYYEAKKMLFNQVNSMIVNIDDEYGLRLMRECVVNNKITISTQNDDADYTAHNIKLSAAGVKFEMVQIGNIQRVDFPMPGDFSVSNALLASAAAIQLGVNIKSVVESLKTSKGVRGRAEVLYHNDFTVLCDFAHTGDAIEKVLSGIAPFVDGRFFVLFGCAGERDAKKRPQMASAVVKYADFTVLTSDNPRKEDPYDIINDVEPTLKNSGKPYVVEVERRDALQKALSLLEKNDVLILCGKGHEDYQVVDGVTIYLDEHRIVKEWLIKNGKLA